MRKYWFVFSIYWQEGLQQRASFFMERFRSLVVLISFYYFWTALLAHRASFAGYDRSQMITYILGMNILRGIVFASRTYEIAGEINHGRLSGYLLKPVNFMAYTFFRDMAEKSINSVSALIEVIGLSWVLHVGIRWPHQASTWAYFLIAIVGAMILNFIMSFIMGCWGFWTAESGGPRFLFELFLEFSAGAFFPLDVLSPKLQAILKMFPSPYLVFYPLHVFLEKLSPAQVINGLGCQLFWITSFGIIAYVVWQKGVEAYGAQGS